MYEVFINNSPLVLTENHMDDNSIKITYSDTINWMELVSSLERGEHEKISVICANIEVAWQSFSHSFRKIIAAGGLVRNINNEFLFIFRNQKWDLPKGKLEENESIKACSIREVEEECGVNGLKISFPLNTSYHMYIENDCWILKETYWFVMDTSFVGDLVAQQEEGIQFVEWKSPSELEECLSNTYSNIQKVLQNYYTLTA
jgi:8-oxo-dGTP pyrophosphatase MutT (NUDIX family)